MVLDAFVIERTHLSVEVIADHCRNTTHFERTVLSGVTTNAFKAAAEAQCGESLIGRTAPFPGLPESLIADQMTVSTFEVGVEDIILRGDSAGIVIACACEHGRLFAVVEVLALSARITDHATAFVRAGVQDVWDASQLDLAIAWYVQPDGSVVVIYT